MAGVGRKETVRFKPFEGQSGHSHQTCASLLIIQTIANNALNLLCDIAIPRKETALMATQGLSDKTIIAFFVAPLVPGAFASLYFGVPVADLTLKDPPHYMAFMGG
jgi:hypothetical protein